MVIFFGVAKISNIFMGCLKFLIFFGVNGRCWAYRDQAAFLNLMQIFYYFFNLDQIINEPTRITPTTSSLLGHILCNDKEKICQPGTISIGLGDHFMTYYTRKISKGQISKHKYVKIRYLKITQRKNLFLNLLVLIGVNVLMLAISILLGQLSGSVFVQL